MKKLIDYSKCVALVCLSLLALPLPAQQNYEAGLLGGVSTMLPLDATNSGTGNSGEVQTDIGFGGGFSVGHNNGNRWGGEFRYLFLKQDYELDSSQTIDFTGQSHTVHYDVLFYFTDLDARVRPFVAAGGGIRVYQGTGTEQPDQPLSDLVVFTNIDQTMLMGDFGAGVKVRVGERGLFRIEFRDYITDLPDEVIAPGIGASVDSTMHHLTPIFGFSWTF